MAESDERNGYAASGRGCEVLLKMLLKGKNVLITGCARGIGRSMLEAFVGNGANVWACCRTRTAEFDRLAATLAATGGVWVTPLYFDLTDERAVKEAVKAILAQKVPLDTLVNNAGITYNALFQMTPMEKTREVFEVNFFAPMLLAQCLVRMMVRQKSGSIIQVSSTAALDSNPGRSAYGASKAALATMTRAMAHELAIHNIRVNAIAPGITDTEMVTSSMAHAAIDLAVRQTRLKRLGKPSEIAGAAVFLASDYATYVTGEVLRVDGGLQN